MKLARLVRAAAIGVAVFVGLMVAGTSGTSGVFLSLLYLLLVVPYLWIAATPIYYPSVTEGITDFSRIGLSVRRLRALPLAVRLAPKHPLALRICAIILICVGLAPLLVLPAIFLHPESLKFFTDATSNAFSFVEFGCLVGIFVLNRVLRVGLGFWSIPGACESIGIDWERWRKSTRTTPLQERSLSSTGLRYLAGAIALLGFTGGLIGWLIFIPVATVILRLAIGFDQRRTRRLIEGVSASSVRAEVVYLRAFSDDAGLSSANFFSGRSIEEEICMAAGMGDRRVVALGKPDERLPPLGATRVYETNEGWKGTIAEWIAHADQIVLVAATTRATSWEKDQISRSQKLGELLIVFPKQEKETIKETFDRILRLTGVQLEEPKLDEKCKIIGINFLSSGSPGLCTSSTGHLYDLTEAIKWHAIQLQDVSPRNESPNKRMESNG